MAHQMESTTGLCRDDKGKVRLPFLLGLFAIVFAVILSASSLYARPAALQSITNSSEKLPTLTTARPAHNLTSGEAARAYPVHLRGVVTYYDPRIGSKRAALFVHDSTGTIYVELAEGTLGDFFPGTLLDVRGVSGTGEFAPIVAKPQVKVIGHSDLPANPPRKSFTRLLTGAEDGQWIEAEGLIHSVAEYEHNVSLQMAMEGGTVTIVMVKEAGARYSGLVDAKVRVHANAAPTFNSGRQMIGVRLMCPGISAITVVEAVSGDPFKLPTIPIDRLSRWDQVDASLHRIRLHGKVTLQWPGSSLCIRDATRGICTQTAQDTPVALGDEVDVAGFTGISGSAPILRDAVFRSVAAGSAVAAEPVTAEQALLDKHDSELIQIDGRLIGKDVGDSGTTLLLTAGKNIFTAILPKGQAAPQANAWEIGSVLRVTGICSVGLDAQRSAIGEGVAVPKSFRVLMRFPQDALILQRPSWWTVDHAFVLLFVMLIGTLLVLAWVVVLRKRVEAQTHLLRESEERFRQMAMHDALTGLATRSLLQDRLDIAVESVRRRKTGLALFMLDVDKFKHVNDRYGHQAGDEVLRVTACRLLEAVRKSDTVARFGGDEFVVLLPDISEPQAAEKIAANIVQKLGVPILFKERLVPVSVSLGICIAFAAELDADTLMRNADAALYHAKAHGRNCYQVFTPDMASDGIG
jgi:diguanylate cyclase (GGDEF)-like protein